MPIEDFDAITMSDRTSQSPPTAPSQPSDSTSIPTLRPKNQKPRFERPDSSALDLQQRLKSFLPQMAAANAELEKLEKEGALEGKRLEDVGDGEEYVEMDLGLGVLEGKTGEEQSSSEEDSSDESSEDETSSEEGSQSGNEDQNDAEQRETRKKNKQKEKELDILGRLMGHKTGRDTAAAGIEEVE